MIRTEIFPDSVNTSHGGNRRRHVLNLESAGTVNTGTNDFVSPRSLSATLSSGRQSFTLATSSMHMTGHRDWEPSMASNLEYGSQKKNSLESLHAILGHVQCLRSLIVPESCLEVAANSIGSTSNATYLGAPQVTLSDNRASRRVSILIFVVCALIYYPFLRQSIRISK